jgi:PAS domain S-box-containing protein
VRSSTDGDPSRPADTCCVLVFLAPLTVGTPPGSAASSEGFDLIADSIPHVAWTAGPGGTVDYLNPLATEYTGCGAEAVPSQCWVDLLHPDDVNRTCWAWRRATRRLCSFDVEFRLRRHDGSFRRHAARALPVRDRDGEVVKWIGTAIDIEDRYLLEQQRDRSETLLRQVVNGASDRIFAKDLDGRYVLANYATARDAERSVDEIIGRTDHELFPPGFATKLVDDDRRIMQSGESQTFEDDVCGADGVTRTFFTLKTPRREPDGRVVGLIGIARDITERKRSAESLRVADAERRNLLDRLLRAQEDEQKRLARDLHDDSVQMLTALALKLDLLGLRLEDPVLLRQLGEATTIARVAIESLRHLMFTLHPAALERDGLVRALELQLEDLRDQAEIETDLASDLAEEPPPETGATAYRIVQEGLANIRKHAHAHQVTVSLATHDRELKVTIADDGCGFTVGPLQRGHLGLVSMRERAELAGGWCHVRSAPGAGTTVEFALPL